MNMHELLASVPVWTFLAAMTGIATTFLAGLWAAGKWLSRQFQDGLDTRFAVIEAARSEAQKLWGQRFEALEEHTRVEPKRWDAIQGDLSEVRQDLAGRDLRIVRVEEEVRHLPNREEFARLHERIDGLAAAVHVGNGKLEELHAIKATMHRINDYLLDHKS